MPRGSIIIAATFPLAISACGRRQALPLGWAIYLSSVLAIAALAVIRPGAHQYFAATQILLLPCLGLIACRYLCTSPRADRTGFALLVVCTLIACKQAATLGVSVWRMPADERPDAVYQRLTSFIQPDEPVATLPLHWHAFQGRNPWRDACLSAKLDSAEVLRCRWLVLPAEICDPDYIGGFELVERRWAQSRWRTYAYSLWRRRDKVDNSTAAVIPSWPPVEPGGRP